jgi:hypothetical protein
LDLLIVVYKDISKRQLTEQIKNFAHEASEKVREDILIYSKVKLDNLKIDHQSFILRVLKGAKIAYRKLLKKISENYLIPTIVLSVQLNNEVLR